MPSHGVLTFGDVSVIGTSVEFQALLAEIKQKDKQREELLMKLKVCFTVMMVPVNSTVNYP